MGSNSNNSQTTTSSSGGKSTTETTNTSTPYQQEYYDQMLGQANNLYKQGPMQFYGGQTVAGMTPAQMESMNLSSNWVTGGAQDMMNNQNQQYQQMMSGRVNTGAGSPYGDMMNAYQSQVMEGAQDMMGGLRQSQVMSGQQGGSSRGDLLNNRVIEDANKQVANAGAEMYNNAYNQAQNTQSNALGQYGSIMNMPMQMSQQLYNQVGLPQQQYNQSIMDDARQRHDFGQQAGWNHLAQYGNMISGNFGGTQTGSSTTNSSSSGTTTTTR